MGNQIDQAINDRLAAAISKIEKPLPREKEECEINGHLCHADKTVPLVDATKFDQDKDRYDLIPSAALAALVDVYTYGARKYADRNWEKGLSYDRVFGATMRHAWAWFRGEDRDRESGLHHMAHAAFGCLALVEYYLTGKGVDNRPYRRKVENEESCV